MTKKKVLKKIKKYCKGAALAVTEQDVKIKFSKRFKVLVHLEEDIGYRKNTIYINPYITEDDELVKIHRELESETIYGASYRFSAFTECFFHELGHIMTMETFKSKPLNKWVRQLEKVPFKTQKQAQAAYRMLPHEVLADIWWLKEFAPKYSNFVHEFDSYIVHLQKKLRKNHE